MAHVFISYVSENAKIASWVASQLRANGLDPWFSKDDGRITPGDEWKTVLRDAIQAGGYYLPIFSQEWANRTRSVANQELMLAADEARMRPPGRRWMLPLKLDAEPVPEIDLGGGRRLSDVQYIDVPGLGWERGLRALMAAMGVDDPILERGEPLAPGFGASAKLVGGYITYRNLSVPIPELEGTSFTVTGGYIARDEDGVIFGNFKLRAPFEQLQKINVEMGLDSIDVRSTDRTVSIDPRHPTHFQYIDEKDRRAAGMPVWFMGAPAGLRTNTPVDQVTGYDAYGWVNQDDQITGTFTGFVETATVMGRIKVTFDGDFMLQVKDALAPPIGT